MLWARQFESFFFVSVFREYVFAMFVLVMARYVVAIAMFSHRSKAEARVYETGVFSTLMRVLKIKLSRSFFYRSIQAFVGLWNGTGGLMNTWKSWKELERIAEDVGSSTGVCNASIPDLPMPEHRASTFPRMRSIWFRESGQGLWTMYKGVVQNSNSQEQTRAPLASPEVYSLLLSRRHHRASVQRILSFPSLERA